MPFPPALPCCRFSETLLVSQRAHVTFFVKRDKFELAFWLLCSVHAVIQEHPDGVVGSRNCRCYSFAACTADVTGYLSRQTAVLSPWAFGAILHSRHSADCILPILIKKLAVGVFPATAIPNRLLRLHGILLSLKYFPSISLPASCLSMKYATVYRRKLVGASPFPLPLDTSLFETLHIHPCTMP